MFGCGPPKKSVIEGKESNVRITVFLNKVAEDFMKTAVAEKLFDVNFYRRIVEHDRVPLLQALYSKSDAWKKDVMTKLADERKYRNVAAYLKDPEGYKMDSLF